MTYEERKRIISGWLLELLKRYEVPSHLDQNAIKQEMILMVEDINSEIPKLNEGGLQHLLSQSAAWVRKNQTTRKWPTISMFTKAIEKNRTYVEETHLEIGVNHDWDDPLVINSKRIKQGVEVSDWYIEGKGAEQMLQKGLVTYEELAPYKKSLDYMRRSIYGVST